MSSSPFRVPFPWSFCEAQIAFRSLFLAYVIAGFQIEQPDTMLGEPARVSRRGMLLDPRHHQTDLFLPVHVERLLDPEHRTRFRKLLQDRQPTLPVV